MFGPGPTGSILDFTAHEYPEKAMVLPVTVVATADGPRACAGAASASGSESRGVTMTRHNRFNWPSARRQASVSATNGAGLDTFLQRILANLLG